MFRFPSVICTRCTGFFCLAIIKGPPNDIYCIIEEPYKHYFTEKVSYSRKIDGLMLGVGAGFDYYAENIKRAPMWMQKYNLEWVYRLVQDPKRLFKRYWSTNTKFIWNAMMRGK